MEWIHDPKTDPEIFINEYVKHGGREDGDEMEIFSRHYRAGYCWHFAHILKSVFNRGTVCWAAPFGHIVWLDEDDTPYDIEGQYEGEARYLIPEYYLGEFINDFIHIYGMYEPNEPETNKQDLIAIIKQYCSDKKEPYDSAIEHYFE